MLQQACSALESRLAGVDAELAEQQGTVADFDDEAERLLARREDVARLSAAAAGCARDRVRAIELAAAVADLEARLDAAAEHVLDVPWRDAPTEALLSVSVDLLRDRIARRTEAREPDGSERGWAGRGLGAAALLGGLALLAWGLLHGSAPPTAVGAAAAAAGLTLLLVRREVRAPCSARDRLVRPGR